MSTFQSRCLNRVWVSVLCSAAIFLMLPTLVFGQTHFIYTSNTDDSYSILIRQATLNGNSLTVGDEIGVFTSAGLCVGASVVSDTGQIPLIAWHDDPLTPAVDGYVDGDSMHFRFWHASTKTEHRAMATYLVGNGTFGFGPYAYVELNASFNFAPQLTPPASMRFNEDTIFELLLDTIVSDANDADSLLRWQVICGPKVTPEITKSRVLRLTPASNWFGTDICTLIVTDPVNASDTASVPLQVLSVNDLPVLQLPSSLTIAEDDTTTIVALDPLVADVESPDSVLVWTITPDPNIAVRFEVLRRRLRLVPKPNFNGKGNIGLSVKDPDGGVASGQLPITVTPVQDPPTAAVLVSPIKGDTVRTLNPILRWRAATDPDGDKLHYLVVYGTSPTLTTQSDTAKTDTTFFTIPEGLKPGNRYYWQVTVSDGATPPVRSVIESFHTSKDAVNVAQPQALPADFVLEQNYPNPFSLTAELPATNIRFALPRPAIISIRIYNTLGQSVRALFHGFKPAGLYQLAWDGRNDNGRRLSSGLYCLRLESKEFVATRKILLMP